MPTNRKVIDFKIHNLTEEQFQELKEAGQIDPNALYCTPDETVVNFEAVNARIDEAIQTEQQHNIEINARVDETVANFEEINTEIEALKDKGGFPLLTAIWADHTLNNMSWLNADTFSWQSGDVYVAAYNHLVEESNGKEGILETVNGIEIWYVLAEDGHKICPATEESNVQALFESTGVAWYYILDIENKQFKLPRTKHAFTGLRDSVGGYVPAGLPNITGTATIPATYGSATASGAFTATNSGTTGSPNSASKSGDLKLSVNASRSSSIYGNSNTVQPKATQMYLYFYVGNFERDALEQTAGITSEQLNNKLDKSAEISLVPTGTVSAFAGKNPPTGWLKCDGSAVSRTTYAKLFAAIGQIYGGGDGSTTFNLPSLTGRVPFGMDGNYVGQTTTGSLPNVTGSIAGAGGGDYSASGAFTSSPSNSQGWGNASGSNKFNFSFNASRSNSIYGGSWFSGDRVVPSSVGMTYCIKY